MRTTVKAASAIGIAAVMALIASAANAHSPHHRYTSHADGHARYAPYDYGRAYDAYRGGSEEFSGTSVPYDPDGPGYNDFQLQGR